MKSQQNRIELVIRPGRMEKVMEECLDGPVVDVPAHNDELATVHRVLTRIPAHHKKVIENATDIFLEN